MYKLSIKLLANGTTSLVVIANLERAKAGAAFYSRIRSQAIRVAERFRR